MFTAGHGSKLGGPILSRWCKAQHSGFLTEFVNAKVKFAFCFPIVRREVDGLRLLRGVDGAGPLADLSVLGKEAPRTVRAVDDRELLGVLFYRLVAVDSRATTRQVPTICSRSFLIGSSFSNRTK